LSDQISSLLLLLLYLADQVFDHIILSLNLLLKVAIAIHGLLTFFDDCHM